MAEKFLFPTNAQGPLSFAQGMDSYTAPHQLPFGAHVLMQNCVLEQQGTASKRYGYAAYGATVGSIALLGAYELVRNDSTKYLMKVGSDGKLYQHPSTNIPIRLATPYKVTATEAASGSVGANISASTQYQYALVAVSGAGKTRDSTTIDADSGKVTTDATPNPITVTGHGVYGATTYEVYRRTGAGAWGRMTTGLTHTSSDGKTTVTYTDDGNTAPDTGTSVPASNTTDYTLSTSTKVDFISVRLSGNNELLFANGVGICRTDGTTASLIQPSTVTLGGSALSENKLWDVSDAIYTVKGLHYHHRYIFGADAANFPQRFYWSDVDDPGYFPQNAVIQVPDPAGGRVLDFVTKDDTLVVGLTTSVYALWGSSFATTGPTATGNYFSRISDVGVASEWSMVNGPGGVVIYEGEDKQPHYLASISPVKEQVIEGKLSEAISPTLKALTDHANCFGLYDGTAYYLSFPADKQMLKVYFFDTQGGQIRAPVMDTFADGMTYLVRRVDGTLLGADDTAGQLWELFKSGTYTDNGTFVAWKITTGSIGCGLDSYVKKFRRLFVVTNTGDSYTVTINITVDTDVISPLTLTVTGDATYGVSTYGTAIYTRTGAKTVEFDIGKKGHYAKVEFTNDSTTERPTLFGFFFEHTPKRRPRGE